MHSHLGHFAIFYNIDKPERLPLEKPWSIPAVQSIPYSVQTIFESMLGNSVGDQQPWNHRTASAPGDLIKAARLLLGVSGRGLSRPCRPVRSIELNDAPGDTLHEGKDRLVGRGTKEAASARAVEIKDRVRIDTRVERDPGNKLANRWHNGKQRSIIEFYLVTR